MYFLIVIREDDYRVFGASSSYRTLFDIAQYNRGDIFEGGYYGYALITFIEDTGLYPREVEQQWFTWMCGDEDQTPARICNRPPIDERTYIMY